MDQRHNIVINKVDWHLWTCKQVTTWVEMELRKSIADLGIWPIFINDNNDGDLKEENESMNINTTYMQDNYNYETQEMLAEQFMTIK